MIINWVDIDTVLLDMDGTLLDLHYDNYFWKTHLPLRYSQIKGIPLATAEQLLYAHIRSLEGTLNWYCIDYWSEALAVDVGALKSEPEVKHKIKERPHTERFLQFLQAQQKTVALVTNAHPIGLDIKLAETGIGEYLDHTISSHQFKQPKEDQAFWLHLQDHFSFDPKRTLFIDDNTAILQSAQEYGIAYNLGIHQPDSQTHRRLDNFPAIDDFDEIMPQ
jgi:putative hydrolase of the HAD superfamily